MTYLRKDIKRSSSYLGKICTSQTITDCRRGIKRIAHSDKLEKPYTACFFQVYLIMYEGGTKIFFNKRHFFLLFDLQFKAYSFSKQRLRLSYSTST